VFCLKLSRRFSLPHQASEPIANWHSIDGTMIVPVKLLTFAFQFLFFPLQVPNCS